MVSGLISIVTSIFSFDNLSYLYGLGNVEIQHILKCDYQEYRISCLIQFSAELHPKLVTLFALAEVKTFHSRQII